METLFLSKYSFEEIYYLEDSRKNLIGRFNNIDEAKKFCKDMGYKLRLTFKE